VATSLLLANSFLIFGIQNLIGSKKAFINFDQHSISQRIPELLDSEKVVIEVLETVVPDAEFLREVQNLKNLGYTIALDDYSIEYKYKCISNLASIIKIDFLINSHEEIESLVLEFKKQNKTLLAEKVETKEEYEWAKNIGFDLFQGYYFAKPALESRRKLDSNAIQYIKLMSELNKDEPDFKVMTEILKTDVALTYGLLKLVNTFVNPINKVSSIQQSISLLGINKFRRWLTLSVFQNMAKRETMELCKYAFFRMHFLSLIAKHSNLNLYEEELALLGTLSILDTMLELPIEEVVKNLPLDIEISNTLLGQVSKYSVAYNLCLSYEKGEFDLLEESAVLIGYDILELKNDYICSINWSEKIFSQLNKFK